MQRRDMEIEERFDDVDSKLSRVTQDIAAVDATTKARVTSLEERVVPPRQRNTVLIGGWPPDTGRKVILGELHRWLLENAVRVSATWVPGPRHFLAKILFATARDAWAFLDMRPEFDAFLDMRPILEAHRLIKEHLQESPHPKLQMDAGRGIIWLNAVRILEDVQVV